LRKSHGRAQKTLRIDVDLKLDRARRLRDLAPSGRGRWQAGFSRQYSNQDDVNGDAHQFVTAGLDPADLGMTMASDSKKTKADATPKKDVATKVESPAAKDAVKDAPKDATKDTPKDTPKDTSKPEGSETAAAAPANYSRGEGQKPVTAAYKENWNAIFAKKSKKKKR
jgi:hypothetical protein